MDQERCEVCAKSRARCVCDVLVPRSVRTKLLILQHPQEPDKEINSAVLLHRALPGSLLKVGLSWRNLAHALGVESANPKEWLVLYLGSSRVDPQLSKTGLALLSRDGNPIDTRSIDMGLFKGLVVLDGTWSQAKTLWWRNAWLLKLQRAAIIPENPSLYGELRKEPRGESVSTLEAAARALSVIEGDDSVRSDLEQLFRTFLERVRSSGYRPVRLRGGAGHRARRRRGGRRRG